MQSQTNVLNLSCHFDLDSLPESFGESLYVNDKGVVDRAPLNQAMRQLVNIIWTEGGFRFFHRSTTKHPTAPVYRYFCAQDEDRAKKPTGKSRDVKSMTRYHCHSVLTLRPSLIERRLDVTIKHDYHAPYTRLQLSPEAMIFIKERISGSTPSDIYRDLIAARIPGHELATQSQIYYQWQQNNRQTWCKHPDQFTSASLFLQNGRHTHSNYEEGNVQGLAIYVSAAIETLANRTKELAMDATFGTNNTGSDLFAVLAELDGSGVPLAYCFVRKSIVTNSSGANSSRADPGALSRLLVKFLRPLEAAGFMPTFFGTDKDEAELRAVKEVWPEIHQQLCHWHVKRAVLCKLKDSSQSRPVSFANALAAQQLIPELEPCWGIQLANRDNGPHSDGICQCVIPTAVYREAGRCEPSTSQERDTVLDMLNRHYNAHPLIPDMGGTFRTSDAIHRECATEVYRWCRGRDYLFLWGYLWMQWYRPGKWEQWARSSNPGEMPILKTTMIVEAHWRRVKHDYLHRFNRPRIDLVVWILVTRIMSDAVNRMNFVLAGNHRQASASWRKDFRKIWKQLRSRAVEAESLNLYHTDAARWVCACPAFLNSRFLVCKHILQCFEPVSKPADFYTTITRHRTYPFWRSPQLILLPQYSTLSSALQVAEDDTESQASAANSDIDVMSDVSELQDWDTGLQSDVGEEVRPQSEVEGVEEEMRPGVSMEDLADYHKTLDGLKELSVDAAAKGNEELIRRLIHRAASDKLLLEEIAAERRARHCTKTWGHRKHPSTMFYK